MENPAIWIILVLVLVGALILYLLLRQRRTGELRDRFGEEYDRTLNDRGDRVSAERNLKERQKRASDFVIRPLTPQEREKYTREWQEVKALFVDSPREAVLRGDRTLKNVLDDRGFPMADFDRRYEDLTVNHRETARHYREAHRIAHDNDATTEELRQALGHYEALFDDMVRDTDPADMPELGSDRIARDERPVSSPAQRRD